MRKYTVLRVNAWFKHFDDTTINYLTTDGFHPTEGIRTAPGEYIKVETPDDEVFQKNKSYLMTLEELPDMPRATGGNPRPYEDFIEERRRRDENKIVPAAGRIFRGIKE
jgi:hypothetical protein